MSDRYDWIDDEKRKWYDSPILSDALIRAYDRGHSVASSAAKAELEECKQAKVDQKMNTEHAELLRSFCDRAQALLCSDDAKAPHLNMRQELSGGLITDTVLGVIRDLLTRDAEIKKERDTSLADAGTARHWAVMLANHINRKRCLVRETLTQEQVLHAIEVADANHDSLKALCKRIDKAKSVLDGKEATT